MRLEVAKARALLVRLGQAEAAHARELAQHLTDRVEPRRMLIGRARRHLGRVGVGIRVGVRAGVRVRVGVRAGLGLGLGLDVDSPRQF